MNVVVAEENWEKDYNIFLGEIYEFVAEFVQFEADDQYTEIVLLAFELNENNAEQSENHSVQKKNRKEQNEA